MYARVSKVMAQFVLKIEKLSHIMRPTPILEMAHAYGLLPQLWLLVQHITRLVEIAKSKVLGEKPQMAIILDSAGKDLRKKEKILFYNHCGFIKVLDCFNYS